MDEPLSHYGALLRKAGCSLEDAAARGALICIDGTSAPYPWMAKQGPEVGRPPRVLHLRIDALANLLPVCVTSSVSITPQAADAAPLKAADAPRSRPRFILLKKPGLRPAAVGPRGEVDADVAITPPETLAASPCPSPLPSRVFTFHSLRGGPLRPLAALVRSCFHEMDPTGGGASRHVLVIDDITTLHVAGGLSSSQTLVSCPGVARYSFGLSI